MAQNNNNSSLHHFAHGLLLVVLLLLLPTGVWTAEKNFYNNNENDRQSFLQQPPKTVNATAGDLVTLPCVISKRVGVVRWTRDGYELDSHDPVNGTFKNEAYSRYSMPGNFESGNYTLVINTANAVEDNATFECQVGPGPDGNENAKLRTSTIMNVVTAPFGLKIIDDPIKTANESSMVELSCSVYGGRPPVQLIWINASSGDTMTNNTNGVDFVVETKEFLNDSFWNSKLYGIKSVVRFKIQRDHHNKTIICEGSNALATKTSSIKLDVVNGSVNLVNTPLNVVNITHDQPDEDDNGVPMFVIIFSVTTTIIIIIIIVIGIMLRVNKHRTGTINITATEDSLVMDLSRREMVEDEVTGKNYHDASRANANDDDDLDSVFSGTKV